MLPSVRKDGKRWGSDEIIRRSLPSVIRLLSSEVAPSLSLQDDVAESASHSENILQPCQRGVKNDDAFPWQLMGLPENLCRQVTSQRIAKVEGTS